VADEPIRILLVDDDQIVREAILLALQREGFDVATVASFEVDTVLTAARDHCPLVVLLDFHLEDSTSSELIGPLVAAGTTVLMLTGAADPEILGSCLDLGAAGIILKRQPLLDLVRAIELAVEGLAPLRPHERDDLVTVSRAQRAARAQALEPFDALTARERSVLAGLLDGLTAEEIAGRDYVSLATVRTQIRGVLTKLDVTSQLAAVACARRAGWTP
jgi:DNA-binding NarL/FixJ family response regulator